MFKTFVKSHVTLNKSPLFTDVSFMSVICKIQSISIICIVSFSLSYFILLGVDGKAVPWSIMSSLEAETRGGSLRTVLTAFETQLYWL